MIYDIVIKRIKPGDYEISPADIPLANWNNDCIDPIEDDFKEFRDLKEAREFYVNGDDIPASRVLAGSLYEIEED